ncbi:BQ2448_5939 [Microbotryum intermedium]|uniref:BQ2448_5939 protein n=1 Tax=Microbotryum intermedium TaxID=269621 RepID=A0A238F5V2_9BASI|nr:BQ2448_5939 [Microbotryum intermedium]
MAHLVSTSRSLFCQRCSSLSSAPRRTLVRSIAPIRRSWSSTSSSSSSSSRSRSPLTHVNRPSPTTDFTPEDFEPVEEGNDTIDLTEQAIQQITRAQTRASNPHLALRVAVESGGCHGYQYKMQVTDQVQEDDYLFQPPSSTARLVIDSASLPLISGSTIDYATELIGSSFRVQGNPHASDKGGCGCGVSWELKE